MIWVFPKIGVSQNGWLKIMENPIQMGWFGGKTHYFWKPSIYMVNYCHSIITVVLQRCTQVLEDFWTINVGVDHPKVLFVSFCLHRPWIFLSWVGWTANWFWKSISTNLFMVVCCFIWMMTHTHHYSHVKNLVKNHQNIARPANGSGLVSVCVCVENFKKILHVITNWMPCDQIHHFLVTSLYIRDYPGLPGISMDSHSIQYIKVYWIGHYADPTESGLRISTCHRVHVTKGGFTEYQQVDKSGQPSLKVVKNQGSLPPKTPQNKFEVRGPDRPTKMVRRSWLYLPKTFTSSTPLLFLRFFIGKFPPCWVSWMTDQLFSRSISGLDAPL